MKNQCKVLIIQSMGTTNPMEKVKEIEEKILKYEADFVVLPEMFACPYENAAFPVYAEKEDGPIVTALSAIAKKAGIYLIGGSIPEIDEAGHIFNTSFVFDREGNRIARHRKMHLFDIDVKGGQYFKESDTLSAGNEVTVFDTEFGRIGLCICYDIRFPELFRLMADDGARMVFCPASFNRTTGPKHWELLFRARAVDNQLFMIGAGPAADETASYISYGHSIAVSPWGEVLWQAGDEVCEQVIELNLSESDRVKEQLPFLKHRRQDIYVCKPINIDT